MKSLQRFSSATAMAAAFLVPSLCLADQVLDDFNTGSFALEACGDARYNYQADGSILGGAREVSVRDAHSCIFGGKSRASMNNGSISFYGRSACENYLLYGSLIGQYDRSWSQSPNQSLAVPMNLALSLDSELVIDISSAPHPGGISVIINAGGGIFSTGVGLNGAGEMTIKLSDIPGMTEAHAADVDGIVFGIGYCPSNNIADALVIDSIVFSGGDSDGDGVPDGDDLCADTPAGAIINEYGCSGMQVVETSCPATATYKNHGAYVSCVANAAEGAVADGLLSDAEKDAIVSAAARSDVGKKRGR